ncbi:hypothetical protein BKM10_13845 [Pseudomonas syringae pv. syringae]|nr:hypothetical protein BKM10_13845 [Pseudomonas syringae pv. syringae]
MAFRRISNTRMQATRATFAHLPLARSLAYRPLREQARSHKCGVYLTGRRGSGEITAPEDFMACEDLVGASLLAKRPVQSLKMPHKCRVSKA